MKVQPADFQPVSPEVAKHVLWHFRGEGYQPGSFTCTLMCAFARADLQNQARLGQGFPDYQIAFAMATQDLDGIDRLREIAAGDDQ